MRSVGWGDHLWTLNEDGCWAWTGATAGPGYGQFGRNGLAHRVAYERAFGPIPEGMEIDHLCRNRRCVNPDHLDAVSHEENLRRSGHPHALSGGASARRSEHLRHARGLAQVPDLQPRTSSRVALHPLLTVHHRRSLPGDTLPERPRDNTDDRGPDNQVGRHLPPLSTQDAEPGARTSLIFDTCDLQWEEARPQQPSAGP